MNTPKYRRLPRFFLIVILLLNFQILLGQTNTTIPGSPSILQSPVAPATNHGKLVKAILGNFNNGLIYKCFKSINQDVDQKVSMAQASINEVTKFDLFVNYKNCSASIMPFKDGPYLKADNVIRTTLELLPLAAIYTNYDANTYIIFPKQDGNLTGDYFKLEDLTRSMWNIVKQHTLGSTLEEKYDTKEYSSARLKKGNCGYIYSRTNNSGTLKMFFANYIESMDEAREQAEDKKNNGYSVLDIVCNQ